MNWFRENRFLGGFLVVFGLALIVSAYLLFTAKSSFTDASARFTESSNERARLQRLDPFPNEVNVRKMKTHIANYTASLDRLRADLKARVPAAPPLAPDQFQSRLRQSVNAIADRARANKVKLPDNFYLGFDEFASTLPATEAAPILGQQLGQIEMLLNALIDVRVDSITAFKRVAAVSPAAVSSSPPKTAPPQTAIERAVVELAFMATPSASRKVINQISASPEQMFLIRALHVRTEKDKGPPRAVAAEATGAAVAPGPSAKPPANPTIQFIVGNEKVETSARIELVKFTF